MTGDLGPVLQVAGMIGATKFVEVIAENMGQGDKVVWIKVVGYIATGVVALVIWRNYLDRVAAVFGIML